MSESGHNHPSADEDGIPSAKVAPRRLRTLPWFWIVPSIALLIGLGLAVEAIYQQGPSIEIQFSNAEGLEAGKTKLRYKSVEIGAVKAIRLTSDAKNVIVTAQVSRDAAKLLVKDARFWVVRTRFSGGQLSGLGTLISGAYIGMDVGHSGDSQRQFVGLEAPPTVMNDEAGRDFVLSAAELGSLDVGAPVYFRRYAVGEVTSAALNPDGRAVTLHVFVREPFAHLVTRNVRFWHASGVDLSLDASGAHLHTPSILAMLVGGVAFEVPPDLAAGDEAPAEQGFPLFASEAQAMRQSDSEMTLVTAYFGDSVRGLAVGAPVDFRGLSIGEVRDLALEFDPDHASARFKATLAIDAERLAGTAAHAGGVTGAHLFERALAHGLRAQLRSGNILTGSRYVALDFFPGTHVPALARGEIGTVPGGLEDLQLALTSIAKKIDQVPFAQLAGDVHATLATLQRTLDSTDAAMRTFNGSIAPELSATLAQARESLGRASQLLSGDSPLQGDVREALHQMSRSAAALRELTEELQRHPEALLRGTPAAGPGDHP